MKVDTTERGQCVVVLPAARGPGDGERDGRAVLRCTQPSALACTATEELPCCVVLQASDCTLKISVALTELRISLWYSTAACCSGPKRCQRVHASMCTSRTAL